MRLGTRRFTSAMVGISLSAWFLPLAVAGPAFALGGGSGSISLTTIGSPYTQDFNTLANTGTTNNLTINGWFLDEAGSSGSNNGQYAAGTGSGTAGDTYSFGAAASTERAFGTLFSGTLNSRIGAQFTNNTGITVGALQISYTGEMWRAGVTNRNAADRLDFQISTDATSLTTGTWADKNLLDYSSTNINATAGLLNGNDSGNRTAISATVGGLSIGDLTSFWIRWNESDIAPGADDGLAVDDFSVTPWLDVDPAPGVSANSPLDGALNVPVDTDVSVSFSEPVNVTGSWFTISCASSAGHTAAVSGGPTTFTLNPDTDFSPLELCTVTVFATQVTDQDANDPPDTMAADYVFTFKTGPECDEVYTPIHDIQGNGLITPIPGNVSTEGIVVGDFEGSTSVGLQGFYIQASDSDADADPMTSEGLFVYTGNTNNGLSAGDLVHVIGYARERFDQTTLNGSNSNASPVTLVFICSTGNPLPTPTTVTLPFATTDEPEPNEGMLVTLPQPLVISEYFNYGRFGEVVLGLPLDSESRPFTGTAIDAPGAPAIARNEANALSRITLDDGLGSQNPAVLRHPNGDPFALDNYFRGGDTVANTVGVLGYDFGLYRIQPTGPADYTAVNPRPSAPPDPGGRLRVASQNTLNFFLTLDDGSNSGCGPTFVLGCRGANTDAEFTRQRDKLLNTLAGLGADVIGLNELENTTGVEPIGDPADGILAGLNAMLGAGTYDYIDTGTIGTDAIRVGLIYRPDAVSPVGPYAILDSSVDSRFIDTKSRPVLAQTFMEISTGEIFTVAVNHLKSKGSDCNDIGDPDAGDGQGNCNGTRTAAAQALVDWLATDPTDSGDPDFLIVGDLNSYAMEDPITAIKAGSDDSAGTSDDYTNLIANFAGPFAYSYVFDGQAGYLDHALSSTSLTGQVTGAAEWHINSDEANVLDYDMTFKPPEQEALYETAAYRSSDHDSVLVGLNLQTAQLALGGAGCSEFADGTSAGLSELRYSVNKGKLNGINQGSFSYWVEVEATMGANSFTINQAITTGNFTTLFGITNGSNVFRWDCQSGLSPTISQTSLNASSGTVTVAFNAPAAGTYFLGIKFNSGSVKGKPAPNPTTVHYDFWTTGVTPSMHGLDLVKQ